MELKQQFLEAIRSLAIDINEQTEEQPENTIVFPEEAIIYPEEVAEACEAICENILCDFVEFIDKNYYVQGEKGHWHNPPNIRDITTKELFQLFKEKHLNNEK